MNAQASLRSIPDDFVEALPTLTKNGKSSKMGCEDEENAKTKMGCEVDVEAYDCR